MTNEELWLTSRLAKALGVHLIDIVPHRGEGDDILLSEDRNPNTNGARLLGLTTEPGAQLRSIAQGVASGQVKAVVHCARTRSIPASPRTSCRSCPHSS
jgi:NADH-quinone oxidoreductase subunit G